MLPSMERPIQGEILAMAAPARNSFLLSAETSWQDAAIAKYEQKRRRAGRSEGDKGMIQVSQILNRKASAAVTGRLGTTEGISFTCRMAGQLVRNAHVMNGA